MLRITLARIPQMIVVAIATTFVAFMLVNILPGDVVQVILGESYNPQTAAIVAKELGLDKPVLYRYLIWLWHAVQLDFGDSLTTRLPVSHTLRQSALPTVELVIGAQIVATILSIVFAIGAVATRLPSIDRLGTGFALFCTSMPAFVLSLIVLSLFAVRWHIVPSIGYADPWREGWGANLKAIALPAAILGIGIFPSHMRVFRSELDEQLEQEEYVTLARMKGISTSRLMTRHLARNSSFGLITVTAVSTGTLIAGAIPIEHIFAIPGYGGVLLQSIQQRDSPTVVGCLAVVAVLIVLLNLVADLLYSLLDPRVRDAQT